MRTVLLVTALAVGLLASPGVSADVIAECGGSKGYTYFYPGPMVPENKVGFTESGKSDGSTSIVAIEDKFDVIFTDATGFTQSSLAHGASVVLVGHNIAWLPSKVTPALGVHSTGGFLVLIVTYPNKTAEIYSYHALSETLTLLQHKYDGIFTSSNLMVYSCQ